MLIEKFIPVRGLKVNHRKEKLFREGYIVLSGEDGTAFIDLKLYRSENGWYACVWITGKRGANLYATGSGQCTKGGGYSKQPVAIMDAFVTAGFRFEDSNYSNAEHLFGGTARIEETIAELARYVAPDAKFIVYNAHG